VKGKIDEVITTSVGRSWKEIVQQSPLKNRFFDLILDTQRDLKTTLALKKIPHQTFISRTAYFLLSDKKPPKGHQPGSHISEQVIFLLEIFLGKSLKPASFERGFIKDFQQEIQKFFLVIKRDVGLLKILSS
jgi:ADP-heptose:LPS heptosyltransferase